MPPASPGAKTIFVKGSIGINIVQKKQHVPITQIFNMTEEAPDATRKSLGRTVKVAIPSERAIAAAIRGDKLYVPPT